MQGIDSDLIRGHIDTIILKVLFEGDRYGYEICKEVEEKSNGTYELKQPTLYSCLKRLESQGLISSYWEESEIGGKRHYYKLTEEGRKTFKENYDEWTRSREIIDNLISNPYVKAASYTLVNKDEYENLEKKADLLDDETVQNAIKEAYEKGIKEGKESEPSVSNEKFLEAYNKGLADGKKELSEDIEKQRELDKQQKDEQSKLVRSILSSSLSQEGEVIPWQEKEEEIVSNNDEFETFSWHDEDDAIVETTANGEPVQAVPNDEPALAQAYEFDNSDLPFEENKAQASFFDSSDEEFETEEKEEVLPISYSEETPISYNERPRIESPVLKEDERNPFTFNMDSFLVKSSESYFESDDIDEPKADYIVPEMRIDGLEEKPEEVKEEIKEEKKEESDLPPSPVYHDFGADKIIKKPVEDEIWVDESEFDADSIYLNPDQAKDNEEEATESDTLSLFDEDVKREESTPEEEDYSKDIFEEEENAGNSTFMDFYKSTDNYNNLNPTYTDEESKEKLSSLMNYSSVENSKAEPENISRVKDYVELKNEFEREGLTVKVHRKHLKESKATRSYIESNKINLVTSWTSFGIITFLLTLVYFITNNYRANFNEALLNSVDTTYKYFLIGIAVILIVPVIYTILFLINPYKKKPARYAFRIYMLFAILLTVQLCIITYCVNLQLGFYSFSQPTYNHLLWIVPVIMSLYPIVDAIVHNIYFKSKNFHV